jgi:hypothetical protein
MANLNENEAIEASLINIPNNSMHPISTNNIIQNGDLNLSNQVISNSLGGIVGNNLNLASNTVTALLNTGSSIGNYDSIEELSKEVEALKKKLEEERAKFNDVERKLQNINSRI